MNPLHIRMNIIYALAGGIYDDGMSSQQARDMFHLKETIYDHIMEIWRGE